MINGAGQLGAAQLTFTNAGVVDANQTNALVLNTCGNLVSNTGTLQASGTGGLVIQNTAVVNTGGTVQALAAGSHVDLSGGTIQGGTLKGFIQTVSGNGSLDGITAGMLTNTGTVEVNDLTILYSGWHDQQYRHDLEHQVSTNGATPDPHRQPDRHAARRRQTGDVEQRQQRDLRQQRPQHAGQRQQHRSPAPASSVRRRS